MQDKISLLKDRRAKLASEIEAIDGYLAKYEALMRDIDAVVSDVLGVAERNDADGAILRDDGSTASLDTTDTDASRRGPKGSPPDEIVAEAKKALLENERPMTRYQLVEAVEKAGLVVGGYDKPRNMGTILWRSKQFSNTGEGYWPNDAEPPLPSDYHEPDGFDL